MIIVAAAAGRDEAGSAGTARPPDCRRAPRDGGGARRAACHGDEIIEQRLADAAPLRGGIDREQQQLGLVGDGADQREAADLAIIVSASVSETPAIGRIPAHCERVQASPKHGWKAAAMIAMTSSRSSLLARCAAGQPGRAAPRRRHHAALRARVGRAGIDRLASSMRSSSGKCERAAGASAGAAAPRRPRAPRPAPRRRCRRRAAHRSCRCGRGGRQVQDRPGRGELLAVECLDEQFAVAAGHRRRDLALAGRRRGGEQAPGCSCRHSGTLQPIAMPCAAAIPTRRPVKLPGPTPTRICVGTWPSSISSIIGTSRSAWPRPITSSRDATIVPSPVEQRGGAGGGRRVEREDQRQTPVALAPWRHRRAIAASKKRKP